MDAFKLHMEIQNILKSLFFFSIVLCQQSFHFIGNFFRKCCIHATDFIRYLFIVAYGKPIFSGITGTTLQDQMKFFNKLLCQSFLCIINNHINTLEVICCFNHIIHIQHIFFYTDGVGFKDISGLIMSQAVAFNMIGVIC